MPVVVGNDNFAISEIPHVICPRAIVLYFIIINECI